MQSPSHDIVAVKCNKDSTLIPVEEPLLFHMSHRLFLLIFAVITICSNIHAQTIRDSVLINFRQSKIALDTAYMQNSKSFRHVSEALKHYNNPDSDYILREVTVFGAASPEGSVKFNEWLSRERAEKIYRYMGSRMSIPDSITTFKFLGRDWEGLRRMVEADPKVPYRDDVLSTLDDIIIDYEAGEKESDGNLAKLKRLHKGVPYLYMYYHLFPTLRSSKLVLTFDRPVPEIFIDEIVTHEEIDTIVDVEIPEIIPVVETIPDRPFYMALKTNMLFDILAVPQLSAEFYLGKNFSIVGNWEYGWWDNDNAHKYWRIYGGDISFRWWFGKKAHEKPLTGHHIGIYGGLVTYDFEFGGKGYMGGLPDRTLWDRCNHYFGIEYGYSMPIARRINIEFNLGLGYLGGKYIEYEPMDKCYVYERTKYKHWFGPTKAEISLVWLIGHGNYNVKKGGNK